MMTTLRGWYIDSYTNNQNKKRWRAVRYGVWMTGFDSLDSIMYAINNRPDWVLDKNLFGA